MGKKLEKVEKSGKKGEKWEKVVKSGEKWRKVGDLWTVAACGRVMPEDSWGGGQETE